MKKRIALALALLLSLMLFAACGPAEPEEKTVEDSVRDAVAAIDTPVGEACKALGLTKAAQLEENPWFFRETDGSNLLGRRFTTSVGFSRPNPKGLPTAEMPADAIEYMTFWEGTEADVALAVQLRDGLVKLCGEPENIDRTAGMPYAETLPLDTMGQDDVAALRDGESAYCAWRYEGNYIALTVRKVEPGALVDDTKGGLLTLQINKVFAHDAEGNILWDGEAAATPAPTDRIPEEIRRP